MKKLNLLFGLTSLASGTLLSASIAVSQTTLFENTSRKILTVQQIVDVKEEETVNLGDLDVEYVITDKFADTYRVEITVTAQKEVSGWQGAVYLPDGHQIYENYGILVSDSEDSLDAYNFGGDQWNQDLSPGEEASAVLIVKGNPDEANLSFDNPDTRLGDPLYSSFTEDDRESWREEELISQADNPASVEENTAENQDGFDNSEVDEENEVTDSFGQIEESISEDSLQETESELAEVENSDKSASVEQGSEVENLEESDNAEEIIQPEVAVATNLGFDNQGIVSGTGNFNYGEALQKSLIFYDANKSGPLGNNNYFQWRSDSTVNDGADVGKDLTGGYFDAGDHIKFTQPMAFTIAFLSWSGVDYKQAYAKSGQLNKLLETVKWGTDYFLKSHEMNGSQTSKFWIQVGDASDHNHWVTPEQIDQKTARPSFAIDPNNPGSDVSAGTASALASASMLFAGTDDAYSQKLLQNAIALFNFAETYPGKYSDSVSAANPFYTSWSGYEDEMVLGAMWLYRATGDGSYLTKAENYFREGIGHIGTYTYGTDDHSYAGLALLAKESSDPFFKKEFSNWASNWLNGTGGVNYSAGGFAVRAEWASAPLALGAAYLAEWYNDFVEPNEGYARFAQQQLDYILGENPLNYSYVIGFGNAYPIRPHHRGSAGTAPMDNSDRPNDNLLVGALVGGPRNTDDSHEDRRDDWVTNEVGTSYNAPLAASAIQQFDNYGD